MRIKQLLVFMSFQLLLWNTTTAFAQKLPEKFGFHFKGRFQKTSKIPFEVYSNLIVIKLKINGSDSLNFILDTGVSSIIITDPTLAKTLNLDFVRTVKITGAGEKNGINANVSINHEVDLGFVRAYHQNLVVLDEDILKLSEYMGIPIHGIFGHDLFSRFVIKVDFAKRILTLKEPTKYKYRKSQGERYPIVVTQSKPYMDDVAFAQDSNPFKPLRLVIDTGAGHALLLNSQENTNIQLPDKVIRANLGRGLNGNINGNIGRISKIKIGKYEFNEVLASFPDSLSFSIKFDTTESLVRQGSIGGEFLRRFVITFNYRDSYIVLKPIKSKYRETFEHDMSGMEIRAAGQYFDEFQVTFVSPGSQADKAGVIVGDQIVFFNNKHFKEININDIYRKLSSKEGSEVELFVRRNNELKFIYFKLKRVI
ncbi:aspartyl protease family protein [Lacihabitans lacunae]|uniref:Aspartyl protease family protein n=1 Tax=Lacihabitans lacunae TaxID=1028214 RepID=A0ABV7YSL1_9BACT